MIRKLWQKLDSLWIGNDLETALACVDNDESDVKAIVIAGTGSCSYGTNGKETCKIGGYGHRIGKPSFSVIKWEKTVLGHGFLFKCFSLSGDRGSAYAISEKALRLALRQHERNCPLVQTNDSDEVFSHLLSAIMKQLGMQSLKELVVWTLSAKKNEIAALAPLILQMWKQKDEIAQIVISESVVDLSDDCICLIGKLYPHEHINETTESTGEIKIGRISIGLTGSLFSKDNAFAEAFKERLYSELLDRGVGVVTVKILQNTTLGSLKMLDPLKWKTIPHFDSNSHSTEISDVQTAIRSESERQLAQRILPVALGLSITEKRNKKSMNLDRMEVEDAVDLMIMEEQSIFDKIAENKTSIGILVHKVCRAFQNGGRLFYVGAGTSGRLGIVFRLTKTSEFALTELYD